MKKRVPAMMLVLAVLSVMAGCAKQAGPQENVIVEGGVQLPSERETAAAAMDIETVAPEGPEDSDEPEERVEKDGMIRSYLTGEMVPVGQGNRRPLAIMMSNDKEAQPQYGINRAGVVYEAPVEAPMNRYMAIIEDYDDLERIGSVRSCRTYYTYFAKEFDAIYAHFGQSTFAKPYLKNVDNINGIEGIGSTAYFRSKDKKAPHNAYASFAGIQEAIGKLGYSQEYDEAYQGHYLFAKKDHPVVPEGENVQDAKKVTPGYSYSQPWFEYNEEDGLYYRYQYGAAHMGDEGPVAVKNILIQYCPAGYYATTDYRNITLQGSDWGYYITNGKAVNVIWKKDEEFSTTHYYGPHDEEIKLNPGKTWVCIVASSQWEDTKFE